VEAVRWRWRMSPSTEEVTGHGGGRCVAVGCVKVKLGHGGVVAHVDKV
jgi:hypothetical protein